MLEFLAKLFGLKNKEPVSVVVTRPTHDHDVIDYDGMGNQGRFPTNKRNRKK